MDVDPPQLSAFLQVILDAGKPRRVRIGEIEIEFESDRPDASESTAEQPGHPMLPVVSQNFMQAREVVLSEQAKSHPGYAQLFGGAFPGFKPATEPQTPRQ